MRTLYSSVHFYGFKGALNAIFSPSYGRLLFLFLLTINLFIMLKPR